MGAILAILGTSILTSIASYLSEKGLKVATAVGILILMFFLIPFSLKLPDDVYSLFVTGKINLFFKSVSYFLPINFLLSCLLVIFASKYLKIYFNIIKFLWDKFVN